MFQRTWKFLAIAMVAAGVLTIAVPHADAFWGWGSGGCYSSCYSCYTPCYSSCYSSCYTPCTTSCYYPCRSWYVGCRPGPARRAALGPYRWYSGGGCCSTSCCYSDVCSGDVQSCCNATTVSAATSQASPTPAQPQQPTAAEKPSDTTPSLPADAAPSTTIPDLPGMVPDSAMPDGANQPMPQNSGLLTVWVPYDAKVTVNGLATKSKGSRWEFVSYGLKPGFSYKYVVRAEVVRDGQRVEDTRTVVLTGGDQTAVAFGFNTLPTQSLASR